MTHFLSDDTGLCVVPADVSDKEKGGKASSSQGTSCLSVFFSVFSFFLFFIGQEGLHYFGIKCFCTYLMHSH